MLENNEHENDLEVRGFSAEIRATEEEKPVIEGTAVVYNRKSELMFRSFREIIEPGFFENVLKQDIRSFWNHNSDKVLGRTKNGTLVLTDTERGLNVHIDPPDTQAGRDALTNIRRGDVDQMSFGFTVKQGGDEWKKEADGTQTRILKRGGCERLYEVSPVADPAYPQTSVHVRSMMAQLSEMPADDQLENAGGLMPGAADEEARALMRRANRMRELEKREIKIQVQFGLETPAPTERSNE